MKLRCRSLHRSRGKTLFCGNLSFGTSSLIYFHLLTNLLQCCHVSVPFKLIGDFFKNILIVILISSHILINCAFQNTEKHIYISFYSQESPVYTDHYRLTWQHCSDMFSLNWLSDLSHILNDLSWFYLFIAQNSDVK